MKNKNNGEGRKNTPLILSGIIFAIMAVVQLARYLKGWVLLVSDKVVPVEFSLYAAIVLAVLALWMFWSAKQ